MPQYKDWLVEHPKKGKIPLGKLSHNELCRFAFNLIVECSRLNFEVGQWSSGQKTKGDSSKSAKNVPELPKVS